MKIKDQIQSRREQLGIERVELAERVGVTEQAVRWWENGRSYPSKSKMHRVEQALSFVLDWTEGTRAAGADKTAAAMIDQDDVELLLVICKLPLQAKHALGEIARLHLEAVEQARRTGPPTPPDPEPSKSRSRAVTKTK